ncbi:MAG: hypothetical protein WCD18_22070 [Thermosynechococcaceae cyanobacterium]
MAEWQFLIQKDGDRDWLPLESSSAEILEGRYRLLAQVGHPTVAVDVQLRHEYDLDGIPQEVVQRRWQQADAQGCLELLPSTYLSSGLWEIRCQWAEGHQSLEQPLQKKLSLQVLAQEFELLSDWDNWVGNTESISSPATQRVPSIATVGLTTQQPATVARQDRATAVAIELPPIPKDRPEVVLYLSEGMRLPPMLYSPTGSSEGGSSPPELPTFLPQLDKWMGVEREQPSLTDLESLRRIAKSADRQAVQADFESLAWRQRFVQTLNRLAETSPDTDPSVLSVV